MQDVVLENPTRARLVQLLEIQGAMSKRRAQAELNIGWGTLEHHERVLLETGLIRKHVIGRSALLALPHVDELDAIRFHEIHRPPQRQVIARLMDEPGLRLTDLCNRTGVARHPLRRILNRLVKARLVEQNGRYQAVYAVHEELFSFLDSYTNNENHKS